MSRFEGTVAGRHFLQIPGPTNVPERVLRAMDRPVPDHRGAEMPSLVNELAERLRGVFGTQTGELVLYPGSGTAASEASLVNTLNAGDRIVAFNLGHFSHMWAECARRLGLVVDEVDVEWGCGLPVATLEELLEADRAHTIAAVLVVQNETSTGVLSPVGAVREVLDRTGHPALLLVDAVSSLASVEFKFDAWRVDVALTGSQKGLMLPPGTGLMMVSERALAVSHRATMPRFFLDWQPVIEQLHKGYFPYTPATLLLYGLREALRMLDEEGLPAVYGRHARLAEAVRAAVRAWDLEILCRDAAEYSNTLTAVVVPEEIDSEEILKIAERDLNMSLGTGLGRLKGRVFRIGHLGWLGPLEVLATVGGAELAMHAAGVPVLLGSGVAACQRQFADALLPAG